MKNNALRLIARAAAVLAATGLGGLTVTLAADGRTPPPPPPAHYTGLINDYTPSAAVVKNGPYEIRGKWSLDLDLRRGTAKFSAALNMETSDFGTSEVVTNAQGVSQPLVNKDDPGTRGAHTHHIVMTDGAITTDWPSCPKLNPAATGGFVVTGPALITGNGSPAPFGSSSTLTICILGGVNVTTGPSVMFSNITLTFGAPANTHFGMFPIHGVILSCAAPWEFESKDCTVQQPD
jgi:hypothetical protein